MRRPSAAIACLSLLVLLALPAPLLGAEADCELSVTPKSGPPGTMFVFSGSGYSPTMLTLSQDGTEPRVVDPQLGGADPWEFELVATEEDAGKWTVTASIPDTECAGTAVIRVTLPNTATGDDAAGAATRQVALLAALIGLVALFVVASHMFLPRFARLPEHRRHR